MTARSTSAGPVPHLAIHPPWSVTLHLAMLLGGAAWQAVLYGSLQALAIGPLLLLAGLVPLLSSLVRGGPASRAYVRVFCVGWFAAAVAAAYAEWLHDPVQIASDPAAFFDLARGAASGLQLDEIAALSEGAGAIAMWRAFYDLMATAGFERQRFVGIGLNVMLVAWTAAIAAYAAKGMFGADEVRQRRLATLFSACGLLWLFAGVHLRDAAVLLTVTITMTAWTRYLQRGGLGRSVALAASMLVLAALFGLLRTEFIFVPLVAAVAGLLAMVMAPADPGRRLRRPLSAALLIVGAASAWGYFQLAFEAAGSGASTYRDLVQAQAGQSSLGAQVIVHQPAPLRLVLGSVYMLIFPIPFWSGLFGNSALHFFKSLNALFFYAFLPLLGVGLGLLWRSPAERRADRLFVLFFAAAFVAGIALTSLETRHLGSFLAPLFLFALVADLQRADDARRYRRGLMAVLLTMTTLHLAWSAVKLVT